MVKEDIRKGSLMKEEKEYISIEDVEVINKDDYKDKLDSFIKEKDEFSKFLLDKTQTSFNKIKQQLVNSNSFIDMLKKTIPKDELKAVLTDSQKLKINNGSLKLMTKKNGDLLASLVNSKTNKVVANIPLKKVKLSPSLSSTIVSYTYQMQLAEIKEQMDKICLKADEILEGQENDRLALVYSCYQKLLQTLEIKDDSLRKYSLLQIANTAEDSRNLLMLSQQSRLDFIKKQPESFWGKVINGEKKEIIDNKLKVIRDNLKAINTVSLIEAMSYHELGEYQSAKKSLEFFSNYINRTYLEDKYLIRRLDLNDSDNYWSKYLNEINKKIKALPNMEKNQIKGEKENEKM